MTDPLLMTPMAAPEPPPGSRDEDYQKVKPSIGEQAGAAFGEGPTSPTAKFSVTRAFEEAPYRDDWWGRLIRGQAIGNYQPQPGEEMPDFTKPVPSPVLSADEVNKKYAPIGPDGKSEKLTDKPLPQAVAEMRYSARKAQIEREGILRRGAETRGVVPNFLINMTQMLDPLNAATLFVPGLGEERLIAGLAEVGLTGVAARTGARPAAGAVSGGAAMVPLAGLQAGLGVLEDQEFGMRDFLHDVMMGAAFGATVHAGIVGPYREWSYRRSGGVPPPPPPGGGGTAAPGAVEGDVMPPMGPNAPRARERSVTDVEEERQRLLTGPEPEPAAEPGPLRLGVSSRYAADEEYDRLLRQRGAALPTNKEPIVAEAAENIFKRETEPFRVSALRDLGLTEGDVQGAWQHYDRDAHEQPQDAFNRALSDHVDDQMRRELATLPADPELQREIDEFLKGYGQSTAYDTGARFGEVQRGFHTTFGAVGPNMQIGPGLWETILAERAAVAAREGAHDIPFDSVLNADGATKHAAMSGAVSEILDGRPIEVQPLFGASSSADVAKRQAAADRQGYAQGVPQAEFDATKQAIYPAEGTANAQSAKRSLSEAGERERERREAIARTARQAAENRASRVSGGKAGGEGAGAEGEGGGAGRTAGGTASRAGAEAPGGERVETFAEQIARLKEDRQAVFDLVNNAIAQEPIRLVLRKGNEQILLSKNLAADAPYRLTFFDDRGPSGHIEYNATEGMAGVGGIVQSVQSALRDGFEIKGIERLKTEATVQGEQTLMPGVEPVTDRERAEMGLNKPLQGGEAAMPEGALFDQGARAQMDIFDKVSKVDADLALAIQKVQGQTLHPDDIAEIEAATAGVEKSEKIEDAATQAASCIIEAGG